MGLQSLLVVCLVGGLCSRVCGICPLLSAGRDCHDLVAGTSDFTLVCSLPDGHHSSGTINFFKVDDGGSYNRSHLIIETAGLYEITGSILKLVNISSTHEGRYYCEYNEMPHSVNSKDCITVRGKAQMTCQDHSTSVCGSTCTDFLQTSSDQLLLNTSLQYVGGGKCQLKQTVSRTVLSKASYTQWSCINRTQCRQTGTIEPLYVADCDNNFDLLLGNLSEEDSGEYVFSVQLMADNGLPECSRLFKRFNITVTPPLDTTMEPNDTTTTTSTSHRPGSKTPEVTLPPNTTMEPNDTTTTTDHYNTTAPRGNTPVPLQLNYVIGIPVGTSLFILLLIAVIAAVVFIILCKTCRTDSTYFSSKTAIIKSDVKVAPLDTLTHSPSVYSNTSVQNTKLDSVNYCDEDPPLSSIFFSPESVEV